MKKKNQKKKERNNSPSNIRKNAQNYVKSKQNIVTTVFYLFSRLVYPNISFHFNRGTYNNILEIYIHGTE